VNAVCVGVEEQDDAMVSATGKLERVGNVRSNRVDQGLEERILSKAFLGNSQGIHRFALHGKHRLELGISYTAYGLGGRIAFYYE
jgi:hypothetical protein